MENFRKIKQLNEQKAHKQHTISTQIVRTLSQQSDKKTSFLKYSVIQRPSSKQQTETSFKTQLNSNDSFTIKNLDSNHIQRINDDNEIDSLLRNVQQIPEIQVVALLQKIWNQYLTQVEKEQEQFLQACYQGDIKKVKKVVESKGKHPIDPIQLSTIQGQNGIHLATACGSYRNIEIIALLASYKVDINGRTKEEGRTPLILASILGNQLASKALLELGADPNIQDYEGNTALHHACTFQQEAIVGILIAKQCSLQIINQKGQTPIQCIHSVRILQLIKLDTNQNKSIQKEGEALIPNNRHDHIQKLLERLSAQDTQTGTQSVFSANENHKKLIVGKRREKIKQILIKQIKQISLSNFRKVSMLGRGAFGQVFLVENTIDNKQYAMKCLDKSSIVKQNILRYAMTQRKILSTINHPFIVKLHFAFQTATKLILIMDYCPGGDMLRLIKTKGKMEQNTLKKYICQIVLAIEQLHKAQIIYRDLKPGNVILDKDGHALLTDFGLSKEASLTHSFCGSTAYLAPQMIWRRGHTKVLDWYLLGVMIYECITGKPPFWDRNKEALLNNIKSGRYRHLDQTECTPQLSDLVDKLLRSNSTKRLGVKGAKEIKSHSWFSNINWRDVELRKQQMDPIEEIKGKPIRNQELEDSSDPSNRIQGWQFIPRP